MRKFILTQYQTNISVELTDRDINQLIVNTRFTNSQYGREDFELIKKLEEVLKYE